MPLSYNTITLRTLHRVMKIVDVLKRIKTLLIVGRMMQNEVLFGFRKL